MSTKTFNRRPYQVGSPSSGDVKDYYFNHFNWKGMSTDKNFLAADQETFEECNNVYMDEEGILRSRPAFAPTSKFSACDRFWVFGDVFVYLSNGRLYFPKTSRYLGVVNNLSLVRKSNEIFVFLEYWDLPVIKYSIVDGRIESDLSKIIYIPTTKIISSTSSDNESKNLISGKVAESFLYSSELGVPFGLNDGDDVEVRIDDQKYSVTFDKDFLTLAISEKVDEYYANDVSSVAGAVYSGQDILAMLYNSGDLYFSYDNGRSWKYKDTLTRSVVSQYAYCYFSKDGSLFCVQDTESTNKDVWVIDAVTGSGSEKYSSFTKFKGCYDKPVAVRNLSFLTNTDFVDAIMDTEYIYVKTFFDGVESSEYKLYVPDDAYFEMDADYYGGKLKTVIVTESRLLHNLNGTIFESRNFNASPIEISIRNNLILAYRHSLAGGLRLFNILTGELVAEPSFDGLPKTISYNGDYVLCDTGVYSIRTQKFTPFLGFTWDYDERFGFYGMNYYIMGSKESDKGRVNLRTNNLSVPVQVIRKRGDSIANTDFTKKLTTALHSELGTFYFAVDNILYISEERYDEDGNFLWYFPEYTKQEFPKKITGLFPISSTEMAIFFEDEIWYSSFKDGVYTYYKSKLPVGLKTGSDVVASYDGSNVLFATERGMASLSYQDFVASSEQTLTFLSDPIHKLFKEFVSSPVKICRYQYWYLCYSTDNKKGYLFDVRNNSWWPLESPETVDKFFVFDNEVVLFKNGNFLALNKTDNDYKDKIGGSEYDINWNFKSQKLHFGAINYNKHIANITLYAVLDSNDIVRFKMEVNNYRKKMDTAEIQSIEYRVDAIRTFVKRVSYFKVNEFQYNIHQDDEEAIKLPLSLSGITVKYRISGEVR